MELNPTDEEKLQPWFVASTSFFREFDQNNANDAEHEDDAEVLFKLLETLDLKMYLANHLQQS